MSEHSYGVFDLQGGPDPARLRVYRRTFFWVAIPEGTKRTDWISPPRFVRFTRDAAIARATRYARKRLRPERGEEVWLDG